MQAQCLAAIEKNTDFIVDLIVKEVTPKEVCAALGFCIAGTDSEIEIAEVKDKYECRFCEVVVGRIEKELNNKTAQADIENCVKHICDSFPKSVQPKCKEFIDAYANEIIKHFPSESPKKLCTKACLCKPNEFEKEVEPTMDEGKLNKMLIF